MKKLLYTLLLGLVVISCQKEEYGGDYAPNALSEEVAIDVASFEATLNRLISMQKNQPKKISSLTAKDAVVGTSYIYILEGSQGSSIYEFSFSDDVTFPTCGIDSGFEGFYIYLVDGGVGLAFEAGSENVIATITGNYSFLFTLTYNNGVKLKDGNIEVANRTGQTFTFPTGS